MADNSIKGGGGGQIRTEFSNSKHKRPMVFASFHWLQSYVGILPRAESASDLIKFFDADD